MKITLRVNKTDHAVKIKAEEKLLTVLRRLGFLSAKSGGCVKGECGACTVLMDGKPINSCMLFALQAQGHEIETVEGMGERPQQAWKETKGLEILQQEFVESGSVQCGYCTPAMILAARALLEKTLEPTEEQVREALSGVLCRCTAYVKPVQAVLKAAEDRNGIKASEYQQEENIGHYEPKIVTIDQRDETVTVENRRSRLMPSNWCKGNRLSPLTGICLACFIPRFAFAICPRDHKASILVRQKLSKVLNVY